MNCSHYYMMGNDGDICLRWYDDPARTQVMIRKESLGNAHMHEICMELNKALKIGSEWRAQVIRNALGSK